MDPLRLLSRRTRRSKKTVTPVVIEDPQGARDARRDLRENDQESEKKRRRTRRRLRHRSRRRRGGGLVTFGYDSPANEVASVRFDLDLRRGRVSRDGDTLRQRRGGRATSIWACSCGSGARARCRCRGPWTTCRGALAVGCVACCGTASCGRCLLFSFGVGAAVGAAILLEMLPGAGRQRRLRRHRGRAAQSGRRHASQVSFLADLDQEGRRRRHETAPPGRQVDNAHIAAKKRLQRRRLLGWAEFIFDSGSMAIRPRRSINRAQEVGEVCGPHGVIGRAYFTIAGSTRARRGASFFRRYCKRYQICRVGACHSVVLATYEFKCLKYADVIVHQRLAKPDQGGVEAHGVPAAIEPSKRG